MTRTALPLLLVLPGCMSMDPYTFNPTQVDAYSFPDEVIPGTLIEQVTFEGADGQELWGAWARQQEDGRLHPDAPGFAVQQVPYVVTFHGNSGHLALGENWTRVEALWAAGFNVFAFDYSGYGRSEGEPSFEGVQEDALAAIDHVESWIAEDRNPNWTWDRVALHGLSLGGGVAVHVADERPPLTVITEDTFASYEALLEDTTGGVGVRAGWLFEEPFDTEAAIRDVDVPVLIMHAEDDSYVPVASADRLYAAANEPKARWIVPGADHATIVDVDPDGFASKVIEQVTVARQLSGVLEDD
jgi:alpha-beta hydrolase superfamily lysophospholipase